MFRIEVPPADRWLEVSADGLKLLVRFGPSEALTFARRHARMMLAANDRTDPEFAFVAGIAIWAVIDWQGVGGPDLDSDEPAPLQADGLIALLRARPDVYEAFDRDYVDGVLAARDEKKG